MRAEVLEPEVALEHRLDEVAERGEDRHHDAEQQAVAEVVPRVQADDGDDDAHHDRRGHAAGEALEGLVRRDVGHQRAVAHPGADEVAGDVVAHRAEHEPDDHADAVGEHEQQAGEAAEDADVGEAEDGDRGVDHRPGVHDLGQVPEQREADDHRA